jgi:hypothetical protein
MRVETLTGGGSSSSSSCCCFCCQWRNILILAQRPITCDIGVFCSDLFQHSDSVPFRSLPSTETSGGTDPAAQRYSSVLLVILLMGCRLDDLGSNPGRGNKMSTQRPAQWLPVFFYRRRGNEHQLLYSAEVKKRWSCTYSSFTSLHRVYKDTFTFPLHLSMFLITTLSIYQIL